MPKTVVMFPDFKGEGLKAGFARQVRTFVPEAIIVPILNGLSDENLRSIAFGYGLDCEPFLANGAKGLLSTLVAGYGFVARNYSDAVVVRLDTAEHPVASINDLAQLAIEMDGMAIGDLDFAGDFLRPESIDELAHLDLFPALYSQTTHGRLSISCAHGFQAFAPKTLPIVLEAAQNIVRHLEKKTGQTVQWGFDGAMALGATGNNIPVVVKRVHAESLRDRPRAKVAKQFENALSMCLSARELYFSL